MSSLQEKYNDWMDAGGNHADFCAKYQLFGWEHKDIIHKLIENYEKLKAKGEKRMDEKTKQRIEEIRERLENYRQRKSEFYTYDPELLEENDGLLHEFRIHAPEDIEFLLKELDKALKK